MTAPAIPPALPDSPFPRAPGAAPSVAEQILSRPAAAFHVGSRPMEKRRTYSWFRKALFVMTPFLVTAPKYGAVLTVAGLGVGTLVGAAMGHISTDPGWNMSSGFAMGTIGVGMLMGPVLAVGQLKGLLEGINRINARKKPGGLDGLIEQRDMRRNQKRLKEEQEKLNKAMQQHSKPGPRAPGL